MDRALNSADRRRHYRVSGSGRTLQLELEDHTGHSEPVRLVNACVDGLAVMLAAGTRLAAARGEVLELRVLADAEAGPVDCEVAVASRAGRASGVHLGLRIGERKMLQRCLPRCWLGLFNRRRELRTPALTMPRRPHLELQLRHGGPHRVRAELLDLSTHGLAASTSAAFDEALQGARDLGAALWLDGHAGRVLVGAAVCSRQRAGGRVRYGLRFEQGREGAVASEAIAVYLERARAA